MTAPAARRYIAGWAGAHELHVLTPAVLESARLERHRLARDAGAERGGPLHAASDRRQQPRSAARAAPPSGCGASCAGRGCWRAARAGSPARPSTPARRSPGACASAGGRASRPARAMRRCWAAPWSTCWPARRARHAAAQVRLPAASAGAPAAAISKAFGGRSRSVHTEDAWRSHLRAPRRHCVRDLDADLAGEPLVHDQRPRHTTTAPSASATISPASSRAGRPPAPAETGPPSRSARLPAKPRAPYARRQAARGCHGARPPGSRGRRTGAATQQARNPLLEQHPLDELGFGLIAGARDPHQLGPRPAAV